MTLTDLRAILEQHRDDKYGDFSAKLIPNLPHAFHEENCLHVTEKINTMLPSPSSDGFFHAL